jgi:hypothetical protein
LRDAGSCRRLKPDEKKSGGTWPVEPSDAGRMAAVVELENEFLRITVNPVVGGTITAIEHRELGKSVLGTVPWPTESTPLDPAAVTDERLWLTRYTGGWPILFPNGGNACTFRGAFHGFHGEASITSWDMQSGDNRLILRRRFSTVPVQMERTIVLDGDVLAIRETASVTGADPATVMWGHHPSFGSDLLEGPIEIQSSARGFLADEQYDPATNPIRPGGKGRWPMLPAKSAGRFDFSRPREPLSAMTCLADFPPAVTGGAWVTIRRLDNTVGVALSWDETVFPCAWLWFELGGLAEEPWNGKTRLIGVEPNTTWPANGLAEADERGGNLLTLVPGKAITSSVRLQVFKPNGAVRGVDLATGRING